MQLSNFGKAPVPDGETESVSYALQGVAGVMAGILSSAQGVCRTMWCQELNSGFLCPKHTCPPLNYLPSLLPLLNTGSWMGSLSFCFSTAAANLWDQTKTNTDAGLISKLLS